MEEKIVRILGTLFHYFEIIAGTITFITSVVGLVVINKARNDAIKKMRYEREKMIADVEQNFRKF